MVPVHLAPIDRSDYRQIDQGRWKNAKCAANIEVTQIDRGRALILPQQKIRNEVTGQNKKNVDAKIAVASKPFE